MKNSELLELCLVLPVVFLVLSALILFIRLAFDTIDEREVSIKEFIKSGFIGLCIIGVVYLYCFFAYYLDTLPQLIK